MTFRAPARDLAFALRTIGHSELLARDAGQVWMTTPGAISRSTLSSVMPVMLVISVSPMLAPLAGAALTEWVGDVLACRDATLGQSRRNGFAIYPGQLQGESVAHAGGVRFSRPDGGLAFFGPDWYLAAGQWRVRLEGAITGSVHSCKRLNRSTM